LDEWYRISALQLGASNALYFVKRRGGLCKLLSEAYPAHVWEPTKFQEKSKRSIQWSLFKVVKEVLPPHVDLHENYLHPFLTFISSGCTMNFDIYAPSLSLAIEYQGSQHYYSTQLYGNAANYKMRDQNKRKSCKMAGITLIEVPYWWQYDKESVVSTLHAFRPDIVPYYNGSVPPFSIEEHN